MYRLAFDLRYHLVINSYLKEMLCIIISNQFYSLILYQVIYSGHIRALS
jgi:hypothetical protein